ncbi:MAG: PhoX family phosphatase [Pseudomonadota bacterium]
MTAFNAKHWRQWFRAFEAAEDQPARTPPNPTLGDVLQARLTRRQVLQGLLATSVLSTSPGCVLGENSATAGKAGFSYDFDEVPHGVSADQVVAADHEATVLLRWGDPLVSGLGPFDPRRLTAEEQERRFGYNNDYIGFLPLADDRALLCVNHEYTIAGMMFPGLTEKSFDFRPYVSAEQAEIEKAAHGGSIVELQLGESGWRPVLDSRYNRRISGRSTAMQVTGPAAGHPRLRTAADPTGQRVIGTLNNCAGGMTPWGTYLLAEENINGYFTGELPKGHPETVNHERMSVPSHWFFWGRFDWRFDVGKTPNEPNRFGWVVEVDPRDPAAVPRKRTALGRFKHEGAETLLAPDGRAVLYMGDDQRFEYLYRFVTRDAFDPAEPARNKDLLDHGTLFAARFESDGTYQWLPLVHGVAPLTAAEGFGSQADVVIEARRAAELLGATPLDRPEDVQGMPGGDRVYVMLTKNSRRTEAQVDAANPRPANSFGHILELRVRAGDHTADRGRWEVLVKAGDPARDDVGATFHPNTSANGWFACPDNCVIDPRSRLWVATDQGTDWDRTGIADGLFALETTGAERRRSARFYRAPVGAEVCGPCFTPDGETVLLAIQHPGADGAEHWEPFGRQASFDDPPTRWPDFDPQMPPRPSVVAIRRRGGGPVG